MRRRPRSLLTGRVAVLVGAALVVATFGCSVTVDGDDSSEGDASSRPSAEAREYCGLVEEFYDRLAAFQNRAQEELGDEATDDALDRRFVGFVREQQQLFQRLAAAAPAGIAAEAAIQAEAFAAVAAEGDLEPLETPAAEEAEDRTVAYEERECGIVVD